MTDKFDDFEADDLSAKEETKEEKRKKYLAIVKAEDNTLGYFTACCQKELKDFLANIPLDKVVMVWRGKQIELKTKTVVSF